MSNSATPGQAVHGNISADTFPDPLLRRGSFIDPNKNLASGCETLRKPNKDNKLTAPHTAPSSSANGVETESQARARRKGSETSATTDTASWLPPGWLVEDRVRASGATAGTVDKYYIDPASGRRFRTKIDVQYYLETGTLRKRNKSSQNSDTDINPSEKPGQQKKSSGTKAKSCKQNFDYSNVPDRIEWVLTNVNQDTWTAFIGGKKVPEYDRLTWDFTLESLTSSSHGSF